ncbi:TonB-dependent receptor [Pelagibacterales bacterium]|nr:TonB-dependent receptor [Pelagibacterales bacterium]
MLKRLLITFLFLSLTSIAHSADTKEIWITPDASEYSRLATGLSGANITIISSDEILKNKNKTIPEILSRFSGIQIRNNYSGVGSTYTTIDMKGFGEAAGKNHLILVNGMRLNDADMAGVNFSAIPHETIERIEVIRGGSAATIYGNGAVGGAINIVTKNTSEINNILSINLGSYDFREVAFTAPIIINSSTSLSISGSVEENDTYRDSGDFSNENFLLRINHVNENYKINFDITDQSKENLLPGPRYIRPNSTGCNLYSQSRTAKNIRQGTGCPDVLNDFADLDNTSFNFGFTNYLNESTSVKTNLLSRDKEQRSFYASSNDNTSSQYDNYNLTTVGTDFVALIIEHNDFISDNPVKVNLGIDLQDTEYNKKNSQGASYAYGGFIDASQETRAIYFQSTTNVIDQDTFLSIGMRKEQADYSVSERYDTSVSKFSDSTARANYNTSMSNSAVNLGLEHYLNKNYSIFAKYAEAFRVPDIDARNSTDSRDDFVLDDQTSEEYEVGFRFSAEKMSLNASIYEMDTKNEIVYLNGFNNTNWDPINRQGLDIDFSYDLNKQSKLKGSFSHVNAKFTSGKLQMGTQSWGFGQTYVYNSNTAINYLGSDGVTTIQYFSLTGKKVPLVAENTFSLGLEYKVNSEIDAYIDMNFVDERFVSNDPENIEPVIPSYYVFDAKLKSQQGSYSWSTGINNLLNEEYYNFAASSGTQTDATFGVQNLYPLAERNVFINFSYNF